MKPETICFLDVDFHKVYGRNTTTKWTREGSNELGRGAEMGLLEAKGKIINNTYNEVCMECFHLCYLEGKEL